MTVTADDLVLTADDNFGPESGEDDVSPGSEFAGDIPEGYVRDRETKEIRPKRRPGRPRKPPSAEELAAGPGPDSLEPDKPPPPPGKPNPPDVPMPRGGVIAKGVDKLYRRAGKILRAFDYELGTAVIECTHADEDDDLTVGQAWEALAKVNPRIRSFLLNAIKGGAWQDLLMAHAPIAIAFATKSWVQKLLPLGRLAESFLEPDEDTEPGDLTSADLGDMRDLADAQAAKIAAKLGVNVPAGVAAAAMRQAQDITAQRNRSRLTPPYEQHDLTDPDAPDGIPPAFRRQQPKNQSRAQRGKRR